MRRDWPLWFLAAAGLAFITMLVVSVHAHARWNLLTSGISEAEVNEYHDWFLAQRQEAGGPCCGDEEHSGGDGHYVSVESKPDGYYIFVREVGKWLKYPGPINAYHDNPTGKNVAWYRVDGQGADLTITWYCLRLAEGT